MTALSTGAANAPLQDVVPVNDNPAYQMVTLQGTQQTSSGSHTTALSNEYENITPHEEHYENVHANPVIIN